ncbi:DUF4145 domain-containing protein [Sporosarcina sp. GW1-11]|uniref:DUF4145 domain-containing protein n=1 Tax=Sporosarcina sp. GW1-11 TaxID=2899126 RepID=UPI00294FC3C0|nr:DUF4145 domain-containing protein [Sporosarcina sp. GW1-11]MDV6378442.1 DUF4145 domain-containing protein [Sporosarcina sp. GW1-11]
MTNTRYFYEFIEPISPDLAKLAKELEKSIFISPRSMLTHSRVFIEKVLHLVTQSENLKVDPWIGIREHIDYLDEKGILITEICSDLHNLRMIGNQAAHDTRSFRISEALLAWETLYRVVKWYVEVYGPLEVMVPNYVDPSLNTGPRFEVMEIEERLKGLEELLKQTFEEKSTKEDISQEETSKEDVSQVDISKVEIRDLLSDQPGFTTIRTITYKGDELQIPHFLRDAFLLPQRFEKSELFLIRLGGEQEARLMSELPDNLEGLHVAVKRFNETNDQDFFEELKLYVEEEKQRRQLKSERPGELFFFYHSDYIVVTEQLGKIPITNEQFIGFPNFIQQLNDQGYYEVGQLPKELVTLGKYKRVGKGTLEKFFMQLKEK